MYSKGKGLSQTPTDMQAKEKLVIYVYEYLINSGAKGSAQTFLNEIRWDKQIPISNEQPGFLLSWWSVFWDLYCASSPERRDVEPSIEAKMFHEFTQNSQPQQLNNNNMTGTGINPPYQRFHSSGPPPGPRPVRMPSQMEFNNGSPVNNQMNNDQRMPPGIQNQLSRLTPPGRMNQQQQQQQPPQVGPPQQNQMNQFNGAGPNQMRGPPNPSQPQPPPQQQQIQQQQQMPNPPMSPMSSMAMQQQQQRWTATPNSQQQSLPPPPPLPVAHNMGYNSSSPVPYNVALNHHGGPGTPGIIPSPQQENPDINFNMIKNVGNNIQFHDQQMGHMVQINTEVQHHPHMNNEVMDQIKHSPLPPNLAGNRMNQEDQHSVVQVGQQQQQVVNQGQMGGQVVQGQQAQINDLNSYNNFGDGVNLF